MKISDLKKIFNKKLDPNIPANGGNLKAVKTQIDTRDDRLKYWSEQQTINRVNDNFKDQLKNLTKTTYFTYNFWRLINFQADYFVNNIEWMCEDFNIVKTINLIFRCNFLYGNCGIYKFKNKFIPIVNSKTLVGIDGQIEYIEGFAAFDMIQNQVMNLDQMSGLKKYVIKDINNFVFLPVNSSGLCGMIKWMEFVRQQEKLLKKIYNASVLINKKMFYRSNDENTAIRDLSLLYDDDSPIIINKDTINPASNQYKEDKDFNPDLNFIFDYYNNFLKVYYTLLGRKTNLDIKGERNIAQEVAASQSNLDILEREDLRLKVLFLKELKKKFKLKIEVFSSFEPKQPNQPFSPFDSVNKNKKEENNVN